MLVKTKLMDFFPYQKKTDVGQERKRADNGILFVGVVVVVVVVVVVNVVKVPFQLLREMLLASVH